MTREEIDKIARDYLNDCESELDMLEVFDVAKKALEQKSCEDCISREVALQAMYELCDTGETLEENQWRDNPHIDAITDTINDLLSVKPTRAKGKWIEHEKVYECSECQIIRAKGTTGKYNFCPSCGADMRGEEE